MKFYINRFILAAACAALFAVLPGTSAPDTTDSIDIVVRFMPNQVALPDGVLAGAVGDLAVSSHAIRKALEEAGASRVSQDARSRAGAAIPAISRTGNRVRPPDLSNVFTITVPSAKAGDLIATLGALPGVRYAEKGGGVDFPVLHPNDPKYEEHRQWGLDHVPPFPNRIDCDIDAPEAWSITTGDSSVTIGIIDSGIDRSHFDFAGRIILGDEDFYRWTSHGTMVAGVVGACSNNDTLISGVDWHAKLYAKKIPTDNDDVQKYYAIKEVVDNGAQILNCSWCLVETGTEIPRYSSIVHLAFAYAYRMNVFTVAAMGNYADSIPYYPAAFGAGICAVGASDIDCHKAEFSSYGDHIDLIAPGQWIYTLEPDNGWDSSVDGTSIASPFVAGIASLLLADRPDLYNDDIENLIRISAQRELNADGVDLDDFWWTTDWNPNSGEGVANAWYALRLLHPPYAFDHATISAGAGANTELVLDNGQGYLHGVAGLTPGVYFFDVYRVSRYVQGYPRLYTHAPHVWSRGVATTGFTFSSSPSNDPAFALPYGRVTDSSANGFTIETYVYDVYAVDGSHVGWYPSAPADIEFAYSVVGYEDSGPPDVEVLTPDGGEYFSSGDELTVSWTVDDEDPPGVSCGVGINYDGGMGLWIALASDIGVDDGGNGSYTWRIPHGSTRVEDRCRIRVIANDGNQQQGIDLSDADFSIEYEEKPGDEPDPSQGGSAPPAPVLFDPAPNPFNPSTTLRYGVSERCAACMVVYDVAGRRIRTLIESRHVDPGYYSIDWDGRNDAGAMVGTGVYFVRFTAGRFVASRKLNLIR